MKLFCWFGLHDWNYRYNERLTPPNHARCGCCGKRYKEFQSEVSRG